MKPSEVLLAAKDKIVDGWVNRLPQPPNEVCTITAVYSVPGAAYGQLGTWATGDAPAQRADRFLATAIGLEKTYGLADWNDSPLRTKQEVIDIFDEAVRLAKEAGE